MAICRGVWRTEGERNSKARTCAGDRELAQRDAHLGCEQYERSAARNGQRNDFKPRTVRTSTGKITLDVPQVRNSETPFQPLIPGFEQGKRVDRALNLAIAEMYLQGISTRKVAKVMQEICGGNGVSASYINGGALAALPIPFSTECTSLYYNLALQNHCRCPYPYHF